MLLPGVKWQQCSPHNQTVQLGCHLLCTSELMQSSLILPVTTLSGHSTLCRMGVDRRLDFLHQHKLFISTQSVKHCQLTPEDLSNDLKISILEPFISFFAMKQFSSRKSPVQEATYALNFAPICTLLSIINKYSLADAQDIHDRTNNFIH